MNPARRTIHPYINHTIDIRNFYTYQNLLRRKPKKTRGFKFSIPPQDQSRFAYTDEKQIQLKFFKALKITKPLLKVDLKEFLITDFNFWKAGILSAWKKLFRIKSLFVTLTKSEAQSIKRYFKHLPRLELLEYQLDIPCTRLQISSLPQPENYLQHLKYSKKIHSLKIQDLTSNTNPFVKLNSESRRCFKSLHYLALRSESYSTVEHSFPIGFCENLESISLRLFSLVSWLGLPPILNILQTLPHLKEIDLGIKFSQANNLANTFREIAKKGVLEKISLELSSFGMQNFHEILAALKLCKLKHFSLFAGTRAGVFTLISDFIKTMRSLESFELNTNIDADDNDNDYIEMCKQINKLQALKSLKLNIAHCVENVKSSKIQCFIPYLSDVLKKPVKMETCHLRSNKLPPSEALQSLISALGTSTSFLTHLKIDFGAFQNIKKTYRSLLPLLKNLSRIQVLEIPGLGVSNSTSQLLIEIARALHGCIYLRVLRIGEVKPTAILSDFFDALEIILSKRGLRQFDYSINEGFRRNVFKEAHIQFPDLKRIIERNPQLDTRTLVDNFNWLHNNQQSIVDFFSLFGYVP